MVPEYPRESLELVMSGKLPRLQEFVARRLITGDGGNKKLNQVQKAEAWNGLIKKIAKGEMATALRVSDVGEGGVGAIDVLGFVGECAVTGIGEHHRRNHIWCIGWIAFAKRDFFKRCSFRAAGLVARRHHGNSRDAGK